MLFAVHHGAFATLDAVFEHDDSSLVVVVLAALLNDFLGLL